MMDEPNPTLTRLWASICDVLDLCHGMGVNDALLAEMIAKRLWDDFDIELRKEEI